MPETSTPPEINPNPIKDVPLQKIPDSTVHTPVEPTALIPRQRRLYRTIAAVGAITSLVVLGFFTVQIRSGHFKSLTQVIVPLLPSPLVEPLALLAPSPQPSSLPTSTPESSFPSVPITTPLNVHVWQISNYQLLAYDANYRGYRMETSFGVNNFAVSSSSGSLAFTSGKIMNSNNYLRVHPDAVYIRNNDGSLKKVMDFAYVETFTPDYVLALSDLEFSEDGELLAITVSDGLFIYDVKNDTLKEIFRTPFSNQEGTKVYNYRHPIFSPDKKKLILTTNYYESIDTVLLTLKDDQDPLNPDLKETSAFQRLIGWANNDEVYSYDFIQYGNSPHGEVTIYKSNVENLAERQPVASFTGYNPQKIDIVGDSAYLIALQQKNGATPAALTSTFLQINLFNGQINELYQEEVIDGDRNFQTFTLLPNVQKVWYATYKPNTYTFELRELKPNLPLLTVLDNQKNRIQNYDL